MKTLYLAAIITFFAVIALGALTTSKQQFIGPMAVHQECEEDQVLTKIENQLFCIQKKDVSKFPLINRINALTIMITAATAIIIIELYVLRK